MEGERSFDLPALPGHCSFDFAPDRSDPACFHALAGIEIVIKLAANCWVGKTSNGPLPLYFAFPE